MRRVMAWGLLLAGWPVMAQSINADDALPPGRLVPLPAAVAKRLARPVIVARRDPVFPDAARAAGHHGTVGVAITVSASGQVADAIVTRSSRSPLLDQAAIDAARQSSFKPGQAPDGSPGSGVIDIAFTFDDRVLANYRCGDAVRDLRWWQGLWPYRTDPVVQLLYLNDQPVRFGKALTRFNKALEKTLARCADTPDGSFVAALSANGVSVAPAGKTTP